MVRLVGLLWLGFWTFLRHMYLPLLRSKCASNTTKTSVWSVPRMWFFLILKHQCAYFNRALPNRLFKDISNYEIVNVLTAHFIVAKHASGADLECGLQTSTRHDGHNRMHSQLRLGEKEGPQGFPLIPCHVCGWWVFSKVNQWFCSVSTRNFLYCYHLWMIPEHCIYYFLFQFCSDCRAESGKKKKTQWSSKSDDSSYLSNGRNETLFFFESLCCRREVSHLTFFWSL